jgi:hypothetical protein
VTPLLGAFGSTVAKQGASALGRIIGVGGRVAVGGARTIARSPTARIAGGTIAGMAAYDALSGGGGNGQVVFRKKRRRMDMLNMRALDRSLRRIEGFERRVNKVTKILGKPKRTVKVKRKCSRR